MTRGHRRWHLRMWLVLGPLTIAALIVSLWGRPVDSTSPVVSSSPLESKP